MGDAHEPGGCGESVLFIFIRLRSRDKHERPVCANQEKRRSHFPAVAHTEFSVMAGLGQKVVERFELARLLHWQYGDANGAKGQESVRALSISLTQLTPDRKPFGDFSGSFQGWQREALKTSFAVNQHAFMVAEIAELVRFDFVFLHFGKIYRAFSRT
jgi:hypothetical protein